MSGQVRDTLVDSYVAGDRLIDMCGFPWGFQVDDEDGSEYYEAMEAIPDIMLEGTDLADDWTGQDDRVPVRVDDLRDKYGARYRPIEREEED